MYLSFYWFCYSQTRALILILDQIVSNSTHKSSFVCSQETFNLIWLHTERGFSLLCSIFRMFSSVLTICVYTLTWADGQSVRSGSMKWKDLSLKERPSPLGPLKLKRDRYHHHRKEQTKPSFLPATQLTKQHSDALNPPHIIYCYLFAYMCVQAFVWAQVTGSKSHRNIEHNLDLLWSAPPHFYLFETSMSPFLQPWCPILHSGIPVGAYQDAVQCIICLSV